MVRISQTVASHKLNVLLTTKPVRQRVRRFHLDQHQIIQTKVDNLLEARFIREVKGEAVPPGPTSDHSDESR